MRIHQRRQHLLKKPNLSLHYYLYKNHYYMTVLKVAAVFLIMSNPPPPPLSLSQSADGYLIISDHGLMKQKILLRWNLFWGKQSALHQLHASIIV